MTVFSVEIGADTDVLKLGFSDGSSFFIRCSYLDSCFDTACLAQGAELSPEYFSELLQAGEAYNAEFRAIRLLALREHSRHALLIKLLKRDINENAAKKALDRLENLGLLNDLRFAELWVQSRIARKLEGPRLLQTSLRSRGVSADIAREALRGVFSEEDQIERIELFLRGEKNGLATDQEDSHDFTFQRQTLIKAGFSTYVIRTAMERLL